MFGRVKTKNKNEGRITDEPSSFSPEKSCAGGYLTKTHRSFKIGKKKKKKKPS